MIRRERKKKKNEFSLIISLESLINQSVWGWGGVLSVTLLLLLTKKCNEKLFAMEHWKYK